MCTTTWTNYLLRPAPLSHRIQEFLSVPEAFPRLHHHQRDLTSEGLWVLVLACSCLSRGLCSIGLSHRHSPKMRPCLPSLAKIPVTAFLFPGWTNMAKLAVLATLAAPGVEEGAWLTSPAEVIGGSCARALCSPYIWLRILELSSQREERRSWDSWREHCRCWRPRRHHHSLCCQHRRSCLCGCWLEEGQHRQEGLRWSWRQWKASWHSSCTRGGMDVCR